MEGLLKPFPNPKLPNREAPKGEGSGARFHLLAVDKIGGMLEMTSRWDGLSRLVRGRLYVCELVCL